MWLEKGYTWNESRLTRDPVTLRRVRQMTTMGDYNLTANYHTNSGFSADGEWLAIATAREGCSSLLRCHVPTGDLTPLIDPLPGTGGYSESVRGKVPFDGRGVDSMLCVAPRSGWVVYVVQRSLRAVHLVTLQERVLIADVGAGWIIGRPSISPDELRVLLPVIPVHPDAQAGQPLTRTYKEAITQDGGAHLRLVSVSLVDGTVTTVYEETGIVSGHATFCPADSDLILLDRDQHEHDRRALTDEAHNRLWTLRLSSGGLREMRPRDASRWQSHSIWLHDGRHIAYQGRSAAGGEYIGIMTQAGEIVQEYHFADAVTHQGHISAMPDRPALILDGHLTPDLLLWLSYDRPQPRIEIIARHASQWGTRPGQLAHPHPQSSPDGRFISFNAARDGRTDVFVVHV